MKRTGPTHPSYAYRFSLGFWLALVLCTVNQPLHAQALLNGNFQKIPLADALKSIEQSSGFSISFDPALVRDVQVQVVFRNKSPEEAFELLLRETALTADFISNRYVVIRKRGESPPPPPLVSLCGQVLDALTREALPFVTVGSNAPGYNTQTDGQGNFTLKFPGPIGKEDQLIFRYLGYQSLAVPVSDLQRKPCKAIVLTPVSNTLMEIVVTDRALDPVELPKDGQAQTGLRTDRAGFVPALGEPDPFRMVQFLPGVASNGDKAGDLIVRGGGSDQNLVLWEGIPIYHTGHLFGVVSALNPYVVNKVNVWKGNFGAEQGGRASCMIDMRSEPTALTKPTLSVGLNLLSAYFSFQAPMFKKKGGILIAARGAFSDLIKNKAYQQLFGYATQNSSIQNDVNNQQRDTFLKHAIRIQPVSEFNDANLKLYYQPNEKTRLEMSVYSGADVLRYRVDYNVPSWQFTYTGGDTVQLANVGASIRLSKHWTPNYSTEWQFASSALLSKYNYAGSFDTLQFPQFTRYQENALQENVFRFDNSWKLTEKQTLRFGFQAIKTANRFLERAVSQVDTNGTYSWSVNLPANLSAFYGVYRVADGEDWSFEAGLRQVTFNYTSKSFWEPRFSAQLLVLPGFRLKANAGIYRQFMRQAFIWNNLGLNNEVWFTADENLKLPVLENRQYAVGASYTQGGWMFDVEFYNKLLSPLTGVNLRFNGDPQTISDIRGTENAAGLEFLLRRRRGIHTHWLSYTYSGGIARYDSLNTGVGFPTDNDQRHTFNWMHSFDWKKWSLSFSWNFHSGRPFTPATGVKISLLPDGSVKQEVSYGPRNTARLPDYHRMDVSAQYRFSIGKMKASLGLSIFNFYNRLNVQSRSFFVEKSYDENNEERYAVGSFERTLLGSTGNLFLLMRW